MKRLLLPFALLIGLACAPISALVPTALPPSTSTAAGPITFTATPQPVPPTFTLEPPSPTLPPPTVVLPSPTPIVPTVEPPATQPPSPLTPIPVEGDYAVVLVAPNDVLNVREPAGVQGRILATLPFDRRGVVLTGFATLANGNPWVQIAIPGGGLGWVNAYYLTRDVPPTEFCADPQVATLVSRFEAALQARDATALHALVSPEHGLRARLVWPNPEVLLDSVDLFGSDVYDWGAHEASGEDVAGTFSQVLLPGLEEVFASNYEMGCDDPELLAGGLGHQWPPEYRNFNFIRLHKPGTPGVELDWRTFALGIEYVGGRAYLATIVQYQWAP